MRRWFGWTGGRAGVLGGLVLAGGVAAWLAPSPALEAQGSTPRHRMTRVTESIYRADAPGTPGINSTSWVFINETDVLATDSEGSPASMRSLLEGIKSVTNKPLRYLVNTHFHIDHAYGNAALGPEVQIIGHEFARKMLTGPEAREGVTFRNFTDPLPGRIDLLRKQVASEADPQKKTTLEQQLASTEATLAVYSGNFPLQPPNLTVKDTMSVWSGGKEFRILWIGRAHTAGDLVVYVPSERAAATGDMLFKATVGWQGDAFPNEHPATLDALKKLDVDLILPGHGDHIQGRAAIDAQIAVMQEYLREEWRVIAAAKQQGAAPEQARERTADLNRFSTVFGQSTTPTLAAVRRIYDIIDGKAQRE